jgi:chromosome segregation ATPase
MKLKELKHDAEDLTRVSASNFDLKKLQDELIILREENVSYIEELKQKNEYLEQLRQENDELKENDLNICLKNVKEELISLQKSNFLSIEQLKIKDESLELHIKQIEELKSEREQCLKYIEKCHNQMKQQNEKFTNIHTCTSDVNKEQEEEDSMKEKIDCLETLKHQIEEADLKYTDKLQKKDTYLEEQKEQIQDLKERALNTQELCSEKVLNSATENNLMHTELKAKNEYLELLETVTNHNTELIFAEEGIKMLKDQDMWYDQGSSEKDNHCEILKKHTEHWGSVEIARSKYIDELKEKIVNMQKEITLLKQEKSVTIKEIKEKDGYLEILKKQIQNLDSTIEVNSKYIDELKTNNVTVQKENDSLEEKNSLYREQLRQKDICLETTKQQIEELIGEKEGNLTCIDELKANTVSLQTEISSLQENNSVYMRRVKEKNDYLETLKEKFEDLNSGKEANLKYIDDLKANIVGLQREINSLQENNSMYMRQVWEKDNCLETLKQQLQDLDCQRKANLTCIDELKANIVSLQKEIPSLEEKYSVYGEQLKEKDNYLETLKQEIEELNCAREKHLKDIDEQKANNECLQKEIISSEE